MFYVVSLLFIGGSLLFLFFGVTLACLNKIYLVEYILSEFNGVDVSYESIFDYMSCMYLGVVFFISGCVVIYSKDYMEGDMSVVRFVLLVFMFVISMMLMVLSGGVISLMLGWDGLGLVSYCLVIYYQSSSSYKAGSITILSNRVGDSLLLVGIGWLSVGGCWNYFYYEVSWVLKLSWLLVILAACTKSAQIPFSAWLPEASAAPTPVSSLVHSSTLVTAGVFLMIRFHYIFEEGFYSYMLLWLSLSTMLLAGLGALVEMDMKKIIASSTLSQLGFSMFSISFGLWMLGYFHMVMHAFFKALMFLCGGVIIKEMSGGQDMRFMGGKWKYSPIVAQGLLISILCLGGFPFLCGFFSKDLILEMMLMGKEGFMMGMMFMLGLSLSVIYSGRMYFKVSVVMNESTPYSGYGENYFMNIGVLGLINMSLFSGEIYQWLILDSYMVKLSLGGKSFGLLIMSVGILIVYLYFYSWFLSLKLSGEFKMDGFLGSMWFLSNFSGKSWMVCLKDMGTVSYYDQDWVEELGGYGSFMKMKFLVNKYEKVQSVSYLVMIMFLSGMFMYMVF